MTSSLSVIPNLFRNLKEGVKVNKLKSRKFWMAVASALFIILTEGLGINIDQQVYWVIAAIVLAYIFGEAYVDAKK